MDAGKQKSLLDWVNSTGIEVSIENLGQLSDGAIITEIIKCMQLDRESSTCSSKTPWQIVKEFLEASNFSHNTLIQIQWELCKTGDTIELAKVLLLLLVLAITCPNKDKLILEMTNLENDTQVHIRDILSEALNEENLSSGRALFDVLMLKAPALDQTDIEYSASPARNSPTNSIHGSPTPTHSRSVQMLGRGTYRTPVKQIFKSLEEEEVFFSVPASCPPLRRSHNPRQSFQDFPSFNISSEASPVQEFLASPAVNYRIKIRDLEQKNLVLEKNLHAERLAKEDCVKLLSENEALLEQSERKIREMSRCSVEKQQLFDEIDELHLKKLERDSLEKENARLKLRLEKYDTDSFESKDLKEDLETKLKENEKLLKQNKNLKSSLAKVTEGKKNVEELEEALKNVQEANAQQEQEISHLLTQLHKLKGQNMEQKEHYEARISDYKSMIEDRDSSVFENEGESMGIFMEQRVVELQEAMKEMEENWTKPDVVAKIQADLGAAKETMEKYQARLHSASSEKATLEEEIFRLQQEVSTKTGEVVDSMKKLMLANQKNKSSEATTETLRTQIETLSGDKESLKSRVKELELEVRDSTNKMAKLQVELNLSINENESNTITIQSQMHRLSESSQKIAGYEHQCRAHESNLTEMSGEIANLKNAHESQMESLEKMMANDQRQISKLEEQIKIFEQEKVSSEAELQDLKKNLLKEKQSLSETRQEEESLKLEVKRYHSACSELEDSCNILGSKLKTCRESSKQKLKLKEEELSKLKEEDESKKTKILTLEEETIRMTKDLASKSEELTSYQQKLKEAEDENASLLKKRDHLEEELLKTRKDSSKTEEKLKEAEDENASLLKKRDHLEEELLKMRKDSSETEDKLKEAEDKNAYLLKERDNLEEELLKMRKYSSETEEKLKEAEDEIASLLKVRDSLEEELRKMREHSSETEEKLKDSHASYREAVEKLANSKSDLRDFQEDHESTMKEKDEKFLELSSSQEKRFSSLEKEIQSYKVALDQKSKLLHNLESAMNKLEEEHQTQIREAEISSSEKVEKILMLEEETSKASENHAKEISSLRSALEKKTTEHIQLEEHVKRLILDNKQIQEDSITIKEEGIKLKESLQETMENQSGEIAQLKGEIIKKQEEYEGELLRRKEEVESLQGLLQDVKNEKVVLTEKLEFSAEEVENLKSENSKALSSLQNSSEALKLTQRELEEARENETRLVEQLGKMDELNQHVEELGIAEKEHLENLAKLQDRLAEEAEQVSILKKSLKELNNDKQEQLAEKESLINSAEKTNTILEDKIKLLEEQIDLDAAARDETVADLIRATAEVESSEKNHKADLQSLNASIQALHEQSDLDAKARDETVADLIRAKAEVESSENNHKADLQHLNASIQVLQENLENSKERCRMLEEETIKNKEIHSASYNALSNELEDSRWSHEKLEVELQDLKVTLGEKENLLKLSRACVEDLTEEHDKVKEEHKSCLEEIDNLKKNIACLEEDSKEEIDALKSSNLEDQAKIESLESELTKKLSYLDEVSQAKTSLQEKVESLKSSNLEDQAMIESLESELAKKHSNLDEVSQAKTSLQGEVESLRILLEKKEEENESSIKRMEENFAEFKEERHAAEKILQESYQSRVEELDEKLKMKSAEVEESSGKLESVVEMWNSENLEHEKKSSSLEMQIEEAKQATEFLKIEKESLENALDETSRAHSENLQQIRTARDEALNSLESEKDRYNALESRLNKEVLEAEKELSETKNLVKVVLIEKEICEKKCSELETGQEETQKKLSQLSSDLEKSLEENSGMSMEIESLRDLKHNSDEKLKAMRAQFAEKYREKQEKLLKLEQDLKDWQIRADEETSRYDTMASMYNDKRAQLHDTVNNLDQAREENMDLQEINRNLKAKNEILATSSSQLNVKKIEEEKKIRSLTTEVHRLDAQLQFAERQIRELRTGSKSFRHSSSLSSHSLMPVEEVVTPVRRRSLDISEEEVFSNDNLFRCRSDTCLDSPSTANKKLPRGRDEILDDSLNDVLRTPVSLQTRSNVKSEETQDTENQENLSHVNRGHISIESSLLGASPSHLSRPCFSQSNPQLNSSRMSQDSTDVKMNSSNFADAGSFTNNTPSTSRGRRASMPRHPSSLAYQTEEEPDDCEFGSLSRLVELQRRNAATLPHLKSSYPVETQGQTPSKCDESVRIGDADGTMRRMTQTSASLQQSLTAGSRNRRMTIDVHNELPRGSDPMRRLPSNETQLPKRKILTKDVIQENPPHKNRRETKNSSGSYEAISEEMAQSQWQGSLPDMEDKEQVDPRRMSMMFEIPNSPRKPRTRAARKHVAEKSLLDAPSTSKEIPLMKTPDRSKMGKKNLDEKKKTPSLMDRMKRPLGRFSKK